MHWLVAVWFTIPRCLPLAGVCDTFDVRCDSLGQHCDTLHACAPETGLDSLEVWWWARWASAPRVLRRKSVAGSEGQRDSLDLPEDEIATLYLVIVDQAGNRSCQSNWITVNGVTGVGEPPIGLQRGPPWFDVQGRKADTTRTGVYFNRAGARKTVRHRWRQDERR